MEEPKGAVLQARDAAVRAEHHRMKGLLDEAVRLGELNLEKYLKLAVMVERALAQRKRGREAQGWALLENAIEK